MRYLQAYYPEGGFVTDGAPAGEFVFPDWSVNGGSTRWFLGVPSFKKCQYAVVADDSNGPVDFIDTSSEHVRKFYPGIPKAAVDRVLTSTILALAKAAPTVGTVFRVYVEPHSAKLQHIGDDERFIVLWDASPIDNERQSDE